MSAPLVVFDLDDTLYLERDFARSGYRAAAACLDEAALRPRFARRCLELLDGGRRAGIFDTALADLGLTATPPAVERLVEAYRSHRPAIRLAPDAERYLARRGPEFRGALITDGPPPTQQAKIAALGLSRRLDCIVCTGLLGPGLGKPHPRPFEIAERWAGPGARLVYVADNPLKDFVTPNARGWATVQIRRRERVHHLPAPDASHAAQASIDSLDDLDDCLRAF